jgi:hypothetical protein
MYSAHNRHDRNRSERITLRGFLIGAPILALFAGACASIIVEAYARWPWLP